MQFIVVLGKNLAELHLVTAADAAFTEQHFGPLATVVFEDFGGRVQSDNVSM